VAERHGPRAITVAVFDFAIEDNIAAAADFFPEGSEIGAKVFVGDDAQFSIFETGAKGEGEFFFQWGCEGQALGFPAETLLGALV